MTDAAQTKARRLNAFGLLLLLPNRQICAGRVASGIEVDLRSAAVREYSEHRRIKIDPRSSALRKFIE
jgi:hypothetical protein